MGHSHHAGYGKELARGIGDTVLRELTRAQAKSPTDRWRAEQVRRHRTAAKMARRHQRRRERAERSMARNALLSAVLAAVAVLALIQWGALPFVVFAGLAVLTGGRAAHWMVERLRMRALPAPPRPPPLPPTPPRNSRTGGYVRRIDRAAQSWVALEPLLGAGAESATVVGGTQERAEQAREVARSALEGMHAEVMHVQALEVARVTAPEPAAAHLDGAISDGLARLHAAVAGFEQFVGAVSELLQAAGGAVPQNGGPDVGGRVQEATDALAGLAAGLREVRGEGGTGQVH